MGKPYRQMSDAELQQEAEELQAAFDYMASDAFEGRGGSPLETIVDRADAVLAEQMRRAKGIRP